MADPPFIHPTAVVDPGAEIAPGAKVWHFCHVMGGARVGPGCILGQNVFVAKGVVLGRNCKVQNNVSLYEGVVLEEDVFCGPSMVFTNVVNPRSHVVRKSEFKPTLVRRGATLGANCTVVCGHTVGRYAFVAAGAVVTRDVPDHALVMGVPGRRVGWMCACGVRLPQKPGKRGRRGAAGRGGTGGVYACGACGARFVEEKAGRGAPPVGRSGGARSGARSGSGGLVPAPA